VILAIALILIGPEQMPVVMRAVAKIIRELRAATNEAMRELTEALEEDEAPSQKRKLPPPQPPGDEPPAGPSRP
jgi:Sec-independent protein translocase protein TatA